MNKQFRVITILLSGVLTLGILAIVLFINERQGSFQEIDATETDDCTVIVESGGNIQVAINSAVAESIICLADGAYNQEFTIDKPLTIKALNEHQALIDGQYRRPFATPFNQTFRCAGPDGDLRTEDDQTCSCNDDANIIVTDGDQFGAEQYPAQSCNVYAALIKVRSGDVKIQGLQIINSRGRGISVTDEGETLYNISITNNIISGMRNNGVVIEASFLPAPSQPVLTPYEDVYAVENILIKDNIITDILNFASYPRSSADVNAGGTVIMKETRKARLIGNYIDDAWGEGINVEGLETVIAGNTVINVVTGIYVHIGWETLIANNLFYATDPRQAWYGISVAASEPIFCPIRSDDEPWSFYNPNRPLSCTSVFDAVVLNNYIYGYSRNIVMVPSLAESLKYNPDGSWGFPEGYRYHQPAENIWAVNNTSVNADYVNVDFSWSTAGDRDNVHFHNNLIVQSEDLLEDMIRTSNRCNIDLKNNLFYPDPGNYGVDEPGGIDHCPEQPDFVSGEFAGLIADPQLVNVSPAEINEESLRRGLILSDDSPARDSAKNTEDLVEAFAEKPWLQDQILKYINNDYFGTIRPQGSTRDIGAHEYSEGGDGFPQNPADPTNTPVPNATATTTPSVISTPIVSPTIDPPLTIPAGTLPPGTLPPGTIICGPIDTNGDGDLSLVDFAEFASSYGAGSNTCADSPYNGGGCGGKDTNDDTILDIIDFANFASRYNGESC